MFSNLEFLEYRYQPAKVRPFRKRKDVSSDEKATRSVRKRSLNKSSNFMFDIGTDKLPANKKRKTVPQPNSFYTMSGELQIVFIYDTLSVRKEEDDPNDAILYFHPDCISEERRLAICGQLMGITHFLVDTFAPPKILTLDNGKFAMRKFGRQYVLALGCSSVTPDWLLEKQADILYNLTIFFHRDIKSILEEVGSDQLAISSRLSLIMDHYIPISQQHGDLFALTFGILPILNLPKSASNISLRATLVLQTCLMKTGVLGGIIMYQNKVIGVEIAQELAQKLTFIQPYQLPPATPVRLQFPSPPGVQIFAVYVSEEELKQLKKHCATFQRPSQYEPKIVKTKENNQKGKIDSIREEEDPSDISLGFSESSLPKEVSENHPELEAALTSEDTGKGGSTFDKATSSSAEPPTSNSTDSNLRFEKFLVKSANKGKIETVNETISRHHSDSNDSTEKKGKESLVALPPPCVHLNGCGPNSLKTGRTFKSLENLQIAEDSSAEKNTPPLPLGLGRCICASLTDPFFPFIRCDGKSISKALLDVYARADNPQQNEDDDERENEPEVMDVGPSSDHLNDKEILEEIPQTETEHTKRTNDVVDETSDDANLLKNPRKTIPKELDTPKIEQCDLEEQMTPTCAAPRRPMDLPLNNKKFNRKKSKRRWSTFEDMMSPVVDTPSRVSESFPTVLPNINESWKNSASEIVVPGIKNPSQQELFSSFRKLSSQDELQNTSDITSSTDNTIKFNGSIAGSYYQNPSASGKIPSCHTDSRTMVDFGSVSSAPEKNPSTVNIVNKATNKSQTHLYFETSSSAAPHHKSMTERKSSDGTMGKNHVKSSLFIYSLGSMRLLLLLENNQIAEPDLIQALWEYGSSSLCELETEICNVEEQTMSTTASQHDHYCYLHYEAVWRSLAHGGRNHSMDFDVVQQMHQDFNVYPNISELIVRGEDHVVYGYQCVGSEIFYQQSAGLQPGLPMPSDLMGKVPFKAKRRLERDHNILLL